MILLITFRESKFRFWKNTSGFRSLYPWDESSHQTLSGDTDRQNQFKNGNNYYLMCFNILVVKIIISTFSFYDAFSPIIMKPYLILNIVFYTYYISIFWMQIHVCGHGRSNELRNLNREIMKIWKMRNPSIWLVISGNLTNEIGFLQSRVMIGCLYSAMFVSLMHWLL